MLENLIFSLTVVLPSFIMILLGWLAVRSQMVGRDYMETAGKLCFTWCLSSRIFLDISNADTEGSSSFAMLAFVFAAVVITYILIWLFAAKFVPQKSTGAFIHASFRSSFTVLGLSMIRNMAGEAGVAKCAGLLTLVVILYNILAVICLSPRGDEKSPAGQVILGLVKSILTNPLIIAVAAAILVRLAGIQLPTLIKKPLEYLGDMAIPLSLLCIGAALNLSKAKAGIGSSLVASLIKTCLMAVAVIPVAVLCGFRGVELSAIAILFTTANPSACYVMTVTMGGDGDLVATSVVLSTMMSAFTVTLALYILRSFTLI